MDWDIKNEKIKLKKNVQGKMEFYSQNFWEPSWKLLVNARKVFFYLKLKTLET